MIPIKYYLILVILLEAGILRVGKIVWSLTCQIEVSKVHIFSLYFLLFGHKPLLLTLDHPTLAYFCQTTAYFLLHSMALPKKWSEWEAKVMVEHTNMPISWNRLGQPI